MNEQRLIQEQQQRLIQQQRLTQQQMMLVKMLEMPVAEMAEHVNTELNDNPALERVDDADDLTHSDNQLDNDDTAETFDEQNERQERKDALDSALEQLGDNDDEVSPADGYHQGTASAEPAQYEADIPSFYDQLKEQMMELQLTDTERAILEYLIGSLESDGLLHKDISTICDELAIYNNIDVAESEIERMLAILQTFDPAGVGARSLQECLLIQINRREESQTKQLMRRVITQYYRAFTHNQWDKIQQSLQLSDVQAEALRAQLSKLNPKPGVAYDGTANGKWQQITPDIIVETSDDGHISFTFNDGDIPQLCVSREFLDMVDTYKRNKDGLNRNAKEAILFAKEKIDKARGFIRAVEQRRQTPTGDPSHHRLAATVFPRRRRERPATHDTQGYRHRHRTRHLYRLPRGQRQVHADPVGHPPAQVLLLRRLCGQQWQEDIHPPAARGAPGAHRQGRQARPTERRHTGREDEGTGISRGAAHHSQIQRPTGHSRSTT